MLLVGAIGVLFLAGGVGAYFLFSHVQSRVDRFLDPAVGESSQGRTRRRFERCIASASVAGEVVWVVSPLPCRA